MASSKVARVGLATARVGEGAGAPEEGESSREKMRQERKKKILCKRKNHFSPKKSDIKCYEEIIKNPPSTLYPTNDYKHVKANKGSNVS